MLVLNLAIDELDRCVDEKKDRLFEFLDKIDVNFVQNTSENMILTDKSGSRIGGWSVNGSEKV